MFHCKSFTTLIISIVLFSVSIDAKSRYARAPGDVCQAPDDLKLCDFINCQNGGTCTNDRTLEACFRCACTAGFTGENCETTVTLPLGCSPSCKNGGTCNAGVCQCAPGFAGSSCEIEDMCVPTNPCINGGACSSNSCKCSIAYTGKFCETRDYCLPTNPCKNGGRCTSSGTNYVCDCSNTGFTGTDCSNSIIAPDPCLGITCQNGGKCLLLPANTYGCQCETGFTGTRCETSIIATHICVTNPNTCQNSGTCIPNGQDYICSCPAGWSGKNCQTTESPSTCTPSPCGANGQCIQAVAPNVGAVAVCNCNAGWTGRFCDVQLNSQCTTGYCQNGGTCRLVNNVAICDCPATHTGSRCENLIGVVTPTTTTTTTPVVPTTDCSSRPCQNGATCFNTGNTFFCACTSQWSGTICNTPRPTITTTTTTTTTSGAPIGVTCAQNPCKNGAQCFNTGNSFFCACTSQWSGLTCETVKVPTTTTTTVVPSVSACASNPCLNGGTCYRQGSSFVCVCTSQFEGENCASPRTTTTTTVGPNGTTTCSAKPCLNGGNCYNTGNSYFCYCGSNFTGRNCESGLK